MKTCITCNEEKTASPEYFHRVKVGSVKLEGECNVCKRKRNRKFRESKGPEYGVWSSMKARCNNEKDSRYSDWGGRGITVCDRWERFDNFIEDMGRRPSPKHSIDRIDNDKGYYKENCKWSTNFEQATNKRNRKDNSSGKVGVSLHSRGKKWQAEISANHKKIYLGLFKDLDKAIEARKEAEVKYWRK